MSTKKELEIDEIRRRLKIRGYQDDELDTMFKTEDDLRAFYADFLKMKTVGNDLEKGEDQTEEAYTLTKDEQDEVDELDAVEAAKLAKKSKKSGSKKKPARKQSDAVIEKNLAVGGKHLGKDAGKLPDYKRLLEQLDAEDDDDDEGSKNTSAPGG